MRRVLFLYRAVRVTEEVTLHLRPAGLRGIEDNSRQRREEGKGPEVGPGVAVEDSRPETRCVKHLAQHLCPFHEQWALSHFPSSSKFLRALWVGDFVIHFLLLFSEWEPASQPAHLPAASISWPSQQECVTCGSGAGGGGCVMNNGH